ncbi:hypothetical protein E2C01_058941 [Portunus trituberculatus]|uniref:Fibronectin type-III domain-containing protein n=1 Tax=Portunus trituberculatus TaxID=210409 RepID=A0A5B7GXQ6_PORTR|nr:hypothetical protein [Portunus trituberculatus]
MQGFARLTAPGRPLRYMPDWEAAAEVKQDVTKPLKPGDTVETKVGGLKHRAEYQFRVIAVNKAGNSPESEATDYHLVKHRARECPPRWVTLPTPSLPPLAQPHPPLPLMCHWGPISPRSLCYPAFLCYLGRYLFDRSPVTRPLCSMGHLCYLWPYLFHGPSLLYGHLFAWRVYVLSACCMSSRLLHASW